MSDLPNIRVWGTLAADYLTKTIDLVATMPAPQLLGSKHILFRDLQSKADGVIEKVTAGIDIDRCIYIIMLDNSAPVRELIECFRDAKKGGHDKLPQYNGGASRCLYVGSSCATKARKRTLQGRLKQHLFRAPKGTYALSLSTWASNLPGGITISTYQFNELRREDGEEMSRRVILPIEDWLADELKPLLGRRGSRH